MTQLPGETTSRPSLPLWIWPMAVLVGVAIAAGSLSYAPGGRLNVLWLWWLWAGLPLIGALVSVVAMAAGRDRPWLFRWRHWHRRWYPNRGQRWQMMYRLQWFWLLLGVGLCLGFWLLLLFTDLAFGWSSTLLDGERPPVALFQALAWPWSALWPSARPDAALLEATHYVRIDPQAAGTGRAGDWWPFLMASLVFYNLLPRVLLALFSYARWRRLERLLRPPSVAGPAPGAEGGPRDSLATASAGDWKGAQRVNWECRGDADSVALGSGDWPADERALDRLLARRPSRLLWQVPASRSPVAELADLMARARAAGVAEQGLSLQTDAHTRPERHLASWRQFVRAQQLTWVSS